MTSLAMVILAAAVLAAGSSVWFVRRVLRSHGQDSFEDPQRVARVLKTAPYDRLEQAIKAKQATAA
jgi:hypothetical protein